MAVEGASLKRALISMNNRIERYWKALSQASMALMKDIPRRLSGDGVVVPCDPRPL